MYERILVPIDGSTTSERGLDEACAVAARLGSVVRLIHVVDDVSLIMSAGGIAANVGELLTSLAGAFPCETGGLEMVVRETIEALAYGE